MVATFRTALVTGGGRGIGRGICVELAKAGFGVAINYRGGVEAARECRELCLQAGAPWAETYAADVGIKQHIDRLVEEVRASVGRIDLLVNNAGITSPVRGDLLEITEENWDIVMSVNLKGPMMLAQRVAKSMIQSIEAGTFGDAAIVNITSISAYAASIERADYCVAKAGLAMLTQLLAHRLADHGIRVYEVRPGIIRTDMTKAVTEKYDRLIDAGLAPIRRWGTPEDVGKAVAAIARGDFSFSTGEVFNVDGGFHSRRL